MTRRHDPRRARRHRSYSRLELCEIFDVGLATIWRWTRKGLQPIDNHVPYLFAGDAVQDFLTRYNKPRQPTGPGELYCVACKRVVTPAEKVVDYVPLGETNGNLIGTCPCCSRRIYQRVRMADIGKKAGCLEVRYEDGSTTVSSEGEPPRIDSAEDAAS